MQEAANGGLHLNNKVAHPAFSALSDAAVTDGFRSLRPDEFNHPANT
jgi:hypothetical protein